MTRILGALFAVALVLGGCQQTGSGSKAKPIVLNTAPFGEVDPSRPALSYAPEGTRLAMNLVVAGKPYSRSFTALTRVGALGRLSSERGKIATLIPGCWGCSTAKIFNLRQYAKLWPLRVGNQVSVPITLADEMRAVQTIKVVRRERITLSGSEYDTFVLDTKLTSQESDRQYTATRTDWWAPSVGWVVKSEARDSRGWTLSIELDRVTRPS